MKLSVSLPEEEVEFLDHYATTTGLGSRSAAVLRAVRLLRASGLGEAYADAWDDWSAGDDAPLWDSTAADGLT